AGANPPAREPGRAVASASVRIEARAFLQYVELENARDVGRRNWPVQRHFCWPTLTPDASPGANSPGSQYAVGSGLGQWDEFAVASHHGESPRLPIGLGLFDTVLPRRDEIPPYIARPVHGGAADQHHVRIGRGTDRDAVPGAEHEQLACGKLVALNVNLP